MIGNWLSLECWLGMAIYDLLFSVGKDALRPHQQREVEIDERDVRPISSYTYEKIVGRRAAKMLQELRKPLADAVHSAAPGELVERIAVSACILPDGDSGLRCFLPFRTCWSCLPVCGCSLLASPNNPLLPGW